MMDPHRSHNLLIIVGWAALLSCRAGAVPAVIDLFPDKVTVTHAREFDVSYHGTYKLVTIKKAWRGADHAHRYLLNQRGQKAPFIKGVQVIDVPVRKVAVLATPYLPHLDRFDKMSTLVAVDQHRYVNTPSAVTLIGAGVVREVGPIVNMNIERMVALETDVVFSYTLDNTEEAQRQRLERAGVTLVLSSSYLESRPLGRAEWLKFTALFYNEEKKAEAWFADMVREYEALQKIAAKVQMRPTVLAGVPFGGTWHVPGGRSFSAALIKDAGGDYLWANDAHTGGVPVAFESVYSRASRVDVWLCHSQWRTLAAGAAEDERVSLFKPFQNGRVYNNNARVNVQGGNEFWEAGVVNPHLVLKDLIGILHPGLVPGHDLYWYQKLK